MNAVRSTDKQQRRCANNKITDIFNKRNQHHRQVGLLRYPEFHGNEYWLRNIT